MKAARNVLLTLLVIAVYLLHQDFWNWKKAQPLLFGFLPPGLAYHAGYSILAAVTMHESAPAVLTPVGPAH